MTTPAIMLVPLDTYLDNLHQCEMTEELQVIALHMGYMKAYMHNYKPEMVIVPLSSILKPKKAFLSLSPYLCLETEPSALLEVCPLGKGMISHPSLNATADVFFMDILPALATVIRTMLMPINTEAMVFDGMPTDKEHARAEYFSMTETHHAVIGSLPLEESYLPTITNSKYRKRIRRFLRDDRYNLRIINAHDLLMEEVDSILCWVRDFCDLMIEGDEEQDRWTDFTKMTNLGGTSYVLADMITRQNNNSGRSFVMEIQDAYNGNRVIGYAGFRYNQEQETPTFVYESFVCEQGYNDVGSICIANAIQHINTMPNLTHDARVLDLSTNTNYEYVNDPYQKYKTLFNNEIKHRPMFIVTDEDIDNGFSGNLIEVSTK